MERAERVKLDLERLKANLVTAEGEEKESIARQIEKLTAELAELQDAQ